MIIEKWKCRSSRSQLLYRIGVLESVARFIGKLLPWSLFLVRLQGREYTNGAALQVCICEFCGIFLHTFFFTKDLCFWKWKKNTFVRVSISNVRRSKYISHVGSSQNHWCCWDFKFVWDHSFSKYVKFSEKLKLLIPWYAHVYVRIKG